MKTKIIATIGPRSKELKILKKMSNRGMNIARINTKHGSKKQHLEILENLEKIKCGIMIDIVNSKIPKYLEKKKFNYVALSYAENSEQIKSLRKKISENVKIISKIETKRGLENVDILIKNSEGIMVARGDLGKNLPFEEVPIFQKIILKKCNKKRKLSITATEMFLSIMKTKVPRRSEVSDIANAVLDGSSALMLSEETAVGKHPVLAVKIMKKVINFTEKNMAKIR